MSGKAAATGVEAKVPAAARALVALLNSRPHATPVLPDRLDDPRTAQSVLAAFGAAEADGEVSSELLDRIRALRTELMAVVEASDEGEAARMWDAVTARVAGATYQQVFSDTAVRLRQVTGDPLIGRIASAVADLVGSGAWTRVRVCANEQCGAVFYDVTRSRTQRWHSYEVCGNRSNVAAYRARRAKSPAAGAAEG
ncbi:CGNR zinc finger domain-containing protein [Streptomyces sp. NPDC101225]|uniref:CGNR zinc finger domain-containing protein n=1 Tax=Streptomyces sp. NPDC101225 TaxID=3366135 RepID=UPI00382D3AD9